MKNNFAFFQFKRKRTMDDIAKNTGTSKENLRMIKNHDRLPKVDLAIRIADYLECSVKDLWVFSSYALLFIVFSYLGFNNYKEKEKGKLTWQTEKEFFKDVERSEIFMFKFKNKQMQARKRVIYKESDNLVLYRITPDNTVIKVINDSLFEETVIVKAKITDIAIAKLNSCKKAKFIAAFERAKKKIIF